MNRFLLLFALLALSEPGSAQESTGRLFFTPEQRQALDARRRSRLPDRPSAPVISPTTRLDGYVRRENGKSTVWVNGEALPETAPEAPRIGTGRVTVNVGESGARTGLRPGETLDRGTGEVKDVLGNGQIQVKPDGGPR